MRRHHTALQTMRAAPLTTENSPLPENHGIPVRSIHNIALAFFINPRHMRDAATDLCLAGFLAKGIGIAGPRPDATTESTGDSADQHTWRWRARRFMSHDTHRRGADQMSGDDPTPANADPRCPEIDLWDVLAGMKISPGIVRLLKEDLSSDRVYLLVDAEDRVNEATRIMQWNSGLMRTEYLKGLPS